MSKNAKVQLGLTKDVKVRQGISKDAQVRLRMCTGTLKYSRASPYGHLSNTDTSLIRTVHLVPGNAHTFFVNISSIIRTTDTKSRPQRENSYKLSLFITDTPMMTFLTQHDFLFVVTYQSVMNCLIVHTTTQSFVFNQ